MNRIRFTHCKFSRTDRNSLRPSARVRRRLRPLTCEPLEDRRLLAVVMVDNVNDLVNGNVTSIPALIGDDGDDGISLREALLAANADAAADLIGFSLSFPASIQLTSTDSLTISSDLTISGPGAHLLTVNGNTSNRVFEVSDDTASVKTVEINGITISGGRATSPGLPSNSSGGGILNRENLVVRNTTIQGNRAETNGGGIQNFAVLTLEHSTVRGNAAGEKSGGIHNRGTLTVRNSTISSNLAGASSGGIDSTFGTLTVLNSTITQNRSNSNNIGDEPGGGIFVVGIVTLHNTIVADNFRGIGNTLEDDISGTLSGSSANNLIGTGGSGGLTNGVNGNQVGVADPLLGLLTNNGGPTQTHALLSGSTAIDAGDLNFVPPPDFDQRGSPFVRVVGGRLDIGAFEFQALVADGDFNGDGLYNGLDIDALVAAIAAGTHNPLFDLTGDTLVNLADRDAWLAEAGGVNLGPGRAYRVGDANLDGVVDGQDFIAWNANKFQSLAAWTKGDFSADGVVDGQDFIAWNANKFTSSDVGLARITVPEFRLLSEQRTRKDRDLSATPPPPLAMSTVLPQVSPEAHRESRGVLSSAQRLEARRLQTLVHLFETLTTLGNGTQENETEAFGARVAT